MIYRFRIILDAQEDIFRDLEIEASASLEDFHYAIAQAFWFCGSEMASFFTPPMKIGSKARNCPCSIWAKVPPPWLESLDQFFTAENHHLIYVYDFLALWTFCGTDGSRRKNSLPCSTPTWFCSRRSSRRSARKPLALMKTH